MDNNIRKNNKSYLKIGIIFSLMFLLSGCGGKAINDGNASEQINPSQEVSITNLNDAVDQIEKQEENDNSIKVYSADGNLIEPEISVEEIDENSSVIEDLEDEIYASDLADDLSGEQKHNERYAYSMLNSSEQETYAEIYKVLANIESDAILNSIDAQEIDHAFRCVMVDYPEIFYVKGYTIRKYMIGDIIDKISFSGTYTMTKDEVYKNQDLVEEYITNVINNAPAGDDYSKIKYVYEYLINNNEYQLGAPENQNILSVVLNGRTVCQGYAKMNQLLLNRMGIFCTLVNGDSKSSNESSEYTTEEGWQAHVWNIVRCNGQYYNMDPTWGDAFFTLVDENDSSVPTLETNYEYFLVNDEALVGTHRASPVVTMPKCTSLDDSYYVREGCYFTGIDENKLKATFDKAYANGESVVWVKCSSDNVYYDMNKYLIDEQHIFNYITQNNIRYIEYEERDMLVFTI